MLCLQNLLQTYITQFYYGTIRLPSTNQFFSLFQSYTTIVFTLTNVWIPQAVGNRQYVPTVKTKVWQFCLNYIFFASLMVTLMFSGNSRNQYIQLFVVLLYAGMCSTLFLHNNLCKKFNPNRLKSCLLTLLFLIKFILMSLFLFVAVYSIYIEGIDNIDIPGPVMSFCILPVIIICMDAFFVYIFRKSALRKHSISLIWNMDSAIISKPLFCTCIFLFSSHVVFILSFLIVGFVYN